MQTLNQNIRKVKITGSRKFDRKNGKGYTTDDHATIFSGELTSIGSLHITWTSLYELLYIILYSRPSWLGQCEYGIRVITYCGYRQELHSWKEVQWIIEIGNTFNEGADTIGPICTQPNILYSIHTTIAHSYLVYIHADINDKLGLQVPTVPYWCRDAVHADL